MVKTGLLTVLLSMLILVVTAQDTLPKVSVTLLGNKALVSWINPFNNVSAIIIQRSKDSTRNFRSIGTVLNVGASQNGFVDKKEITSVKDYYRLFVSFEGGNYLFTQSHRPWPSEVRITNLVIDRGYSDPSAPEMEETGKEEKKVEPPNRFVPSPHVFYDKNQNVIVTIPDASSKNYSLKFFEDDGTFLFELPKVPPGKLIMDKANFNHSGLFRFELWEGGKLQEMHKLYIPQPGRRMPALDKNGYEIRRAR